MVREAHLKFTRELTATLTIHSVGEEGIRIRDQQWLEAIALTPRELLGGWPKVAIKDLREVHFSPLLTHSVELVIVGTGTKSEFPPRELMFAFARRGVGLEFMDTAAAARTYNVLANEGRQIGAVLYPYR